MKDLDQTIFGVTCIIVLVALVVIAVEQSRKTDNVISQLREMRQSMEDAGYVQREPKISEGKK